MSELWPANERATAVCAEAGWAQSASPAPEPPLLSSAQRMTSPSAGNRVSLLSQALGLALARRTLPLALLSARVTDLVRGHDQRSLFALSVRAQRRMAADFRDWLEAEAPVVRRRWWQRVQAERIESLGVPGFFSRYHLLQPPRILAVAGTPTTWSDEVGLAAAAIKLPLHWWPSPNVDVESALEHCGAFLARVAPSPLVLLLPWTAASAGSGRIYRALTQLRSRDLACAVHLNGAPLACLAMAESIDDGQQVWADPDDAV